MENTTEIDQILDKLGEIGYENLENDEKMTLKTTILGVKTLILRVK